MISSKILSNLTFERDAAKARRPSTLRWALYMFQSKFLIIAVLLMSSLPAHARGDVVLFGQGDMETMYQWEISNEKFNAQPSWSPTAGAPPLAINKAVEIADAWIKSKNPEIKKFSLSSVAFFASENWESQPSQRWYFRIEFHPIVSGQRLYGGQFIAVVLFDGTVVEPRAEKRGLK
jgi:hypothetical protein